MVLSIHTKRQNKLKKVILLYSLIKKQIFVMMRCRFILHSYLFVPNFLYVLNITQYLYSMLFTYSRPSVHSDRQPSSSPYKKTKQIKNSPLIIPQLGGRMQLRQPEKVVNVVWHKRTAIRTGRQVGRNACFVS